jgi:hypothetical protein
MPDGTSRPWDRLIGLLGQPNFKRIVERELDDTGRPVPPAVAELVAVGWSLIVTTNLDRLISRAYFERYGKPPLSFTGCRRGVTNVPLIAEWQMNEWQTTGSNALARSTGRRLAQPLAVGNPAAKRPQGAVCGHFAVTEAIEQQRTQANGVPRGPAFSGVFSRVRWPSQEMKVSGRQVLEGLVERDSVRRGRFRGRFRGRSLG